MTEHEPLAPQDWERHIEALRAGLDAWSKDSAECGYARTAAECATAAQVADAFRAFLGERALTENRFRPRPAAALLIAAVQLWARELEDYAACNDKAFAHTGLHDLVETTTETVLEVALAATGVAHSAAHQVRGWDHSGGFGPELVDAAREAAELAEGWAAEVWSREAPEPEDAQPGCSGADWLTPIGEVGR